MSKLIYRVLSYSPLLNYSDDTKFGSVEGEPEKLRFSIARLYLGAYRFYFVTYLPDDGLRLLKVLKLDDVNVVPSAQIVDGKAERYLEYLDHTKPEDIEVHVEALKHRIQQEEGRQTQSFNKINIYNAVLFVIFSLGIPFMINIHKINSWISVYWFFILSLCYCFINVLSLVYYFYKVKESVRFAFKDIKTSSQPEKAIAKGYYLEWYSIKSEADRSVSYTKNIEFYMKYIFVFIVLFLVVYNVMSFTSSSKVPIASEEKVVISLESSHVLDKKSLVNLNNIQRRLLENDVKKILVVNDFSKNATATQKSKSQKIIDILKTYNIHNVEMIRVTADVSTGDSNVMIILFR